MQCLFFTLSKRLDRVVQREAERGRWARGLVQVYLFEVGYHMYAKCNKLYYARKVFNLLPNHNLQSYGAFIADMLYCRFEALQLFLHLLKFGPNLDETNLSGAFSACAVINEDLEGIQVHGCHFGCIWKM